jgi:hypothetical protein
VNVEYGIDLDEVRRVIDAADVLVIRFSVTDRRLLIDARRNDTDGPLVRVVPPVASGEERFKSLKILRPRFRVPDRILTFQWPRHARALDEAGLWEYIRRKIDAAASPELSAMCDEAWRDLVREEAAVEAAAIRGGDAFKTIWQQGGVADD